MNTTIKIKAMKKIKTLLLSLSILITFNVFAASIDFKYTNMKIVGSNLVFDIEIKADVNTTYLAGFETYINYSTTAFGTSIAPLITVTNGPLLGANYSVSKANNSTSRLLISGIAFFGPYSNVPNTYIKLITVSIPIVNNTGNAGINFQLSLMGSGQTWYPTASGGSPAVYNPVTVSNNLTNLPLNPNLTLLISEVGDPSNTTTNFVEIYNAGSTTVDFTNNYYWFLNFNGSSSVQLTGTLAAGAKYTVAYNNTDFTPSLVSTGVGTGGTTNYLLTTYGDYTTGTAIDAYNGTLTGFDYTGKHAVRLYNIVVPNTTPTASEWVISAAENTDMTPGSHRTTITWDGVPSNDWRLKANWAEGFIPDAGHNVSIPNAGAATVISSGDNAYAFNLTITGSLTIQSDGVFGDGSLITYGTVTGNTSVQRYLGADRYWYVTKPVTSATANVFLHTWMFTYNEPGSAWTAFIENPTTPLSQMKGYAVWTSSVNKFDQDLPPLGDTLTAYSGTLNTGTISTSLTKSGDGWNFVGNPYVSAVDWEAAGWTKTNLTTNAYSVWTGATNGTYTVGSGGTNGVTRYIPAAHGFFVNASAAGTLGVSNAVRTHNTQVFYKTEENMMDRLSLTISNGEVNDETVIYFNTGATPDLDYDFDAMKLMADAAPQAFTMMGTEKMAINTVNNPSQTPSVILGVNTPAEGEYTLTASNIESFDASTPIYLEDVLTGSKINLREMSTYSFSSGEGTSERFVVHFAEYQGIGDNLSSDIHGIYAGNRSINVDFSAVKGEIVIYDILGQEISRAEASNGLNRISVPQGNAVYVVKVISDKNAVTKKVFVK
jgi:hypothetical protein